MSVCTTSFCRNQVIWERDGDRQWERGEVNVDVQQRIWVIYTVKNNAPYK